MWEGNQSHEGKGESYLLTIEVYVSSAPKHQMQGGQQTNTRTNKQWLHFAFPNPMLKDVFFFEFPWSLL